MKKMYLLGLTLVIFLILGLSIYIYLSRTTSERIQGVLLFKIEDIEIYSKDGKLKLGDNFILIKSQGKDIENAYFYMPPMPGMGEMKADVNIKKLANGVYSGKVNIHMAGYWQFIIVAKGKSFKFDLDIPYSGESINKENVRYIKVNNDISKAIGIVTEEVNIVELFEDFTTLGYVSYDPLGVHEITVRADSWVVDTFGRIESELVEKGESLARLLSPDVKIAEEELKLSKELGIQSKLVEEKLKYLQSDEIIISPIKGIILEKNVNNGSYISSGEVLYKIVDYTKLWIVAKVPIYYLQFLKKNATVIVTSLSSRVEKFGKVYKVLSKVNDESKTVDAIIRLENYSGLKINEPLEVYFEFSAGKKLAVLESAVVDTGKRQIVFVEIEQGKYIPKNVVLGKKYKGYYEVISGLRKGDKVVVKGTFLLDSEVQIKGYMIDHNH